MRSGTTENRWRRTAPNSLIYRLCSLRDWMKLLISAKIPMRISAGGGCLLRSCEHEGRRDMKRASTPPVSSAGARALAVYEAWMREQEALATASIRNYVSDLSHFIAWYEQRATQAGFQPKGEEDACRMRSLPSGNFGWSSFTRWQTASRSRVS